MKKRQRITPSSHPNAIFIESGFWNVEYVVVGDMFVIQSKLHGVLALDKCGVARLANELHAMADILPYFTQTET